MLVAVRYGGERWLARERELGEVPAREAYPQPDAGYDESCQDSNAPSALDRNIAPPESGAAAARS
jgi:hypothetical protein